MFNNLRCCITCYCARRLRRRIVFVFCYCGYRASIFYCMRRDSNYACCFINNNTIRCISVNFPFSLAVFTNTDSTRRFFRAIEWIRRYGNIDIDMISTCWRHNVDATIVCCAYRWRIWLFNNGKLIGVSLSIVLMWNESQWSASLLFWYVSAKCSVCIDRYAYRRSVCIFKWLTLRIIDGNC